MPIRLRCELPNSFQLILTYAADVEFSAPCKWWQCRTSAPCLRMAQILTRGEEWLEARILQSTW